MSWNRWRTRAAAAAAAASLAMPASAGPYSDLWWNPQESGRGVNVVQQGERAFVTLFVYGPDGKPTWYVSSDARVTAYTGLDGFPLFAGTLYRTEGPWHGGTYDPGALKVAPVGSLSLAVVARDRMRLHYSAEGVSATREVRRLTIAEPELSANYVSQFVLRVIPSGGSPIGTSRYQADISTHFDQGEGYLRTDDHLGRRCEYRGPYEQTGKLMRFSGAFTCSAGDFLSGTFEFSDLEVSANGITGYLRKYSTTANAYGRFAATRF